MNSTEALQVVGELSLPPLPVVTDVESPQVQVAANALVLQHSRHPDRRRQRAGGMGLPSSLTSHEQDRQPSAQPVQMITVQVGYVVVGLAKYVASPRSPHDDHVFTS